MPRLIANTAKMSREDWLRLRREGLGGSDAAAVAGVSKYASPYMVFWDKMNANLPEKPEHVMEAAYWGNVHEPTIRKEFTRRINLEREEQGLPEIKVINRQAIFAHDEYDFIRTNLDGIIVGHERGRGVFEAKTAHFLLRDEWDGADVPNAYMLQCQHNMLVMDADFAYLAVLIGGNTFKYYFIERDEELIAYLIQIETRFWNNHIVTRIPPEMTGLEAEKDMLRDLYPVSIDDGETFTTLPDECIDLIEEVDVLKQLQKELKADQIKAENEVKATMGEVEWGYAGNHKITWKTAKDGKRPLRYKLHDSPVRNTLYKIKRNVLVDARREIEKVLKGRSE